MQHDGIRTEIRRTYIPGEGHLVEEVAVGTPLGQNQAVMAAVPAEPARPVVLALADVPLNLAVQVVEANGLLAVPASFLNETQLEELKIDPATITPVTLETAPAKTEKPEKLTEAQAIKAVQAAESFDDLNRLTANDSRAKVLAAAEARATELKEQGKQ